MNTDSIPSTVGTVVNKTDKIHGSLIQGIVLLGRKLIVNTKLT